MNLRQTFIHNLKRIRKNAGLSQMKLAERCDVSTNYIGVIEIGLKFPSVEMIEKIAAALRVKPYQFFLEETSKAIYVKPTLPEALKKTILKKMEILLQKY
ncbi:MAG: helix-turn-helix transcriptional regulator [Candidatus Margulisbacteria bacterium]|jgi:transcriptional regulator with XRE-family HTH domain|nr:helix-turn-helix transcriptional regulator [Candidatus Margulisiibacteriota bacterium]